MSFPLALFLRALTPPAPPEPAGHLCDGCRHQHEALRSPPSPCPSCSLDGSHFSPLPSPPIIQAGDRVRGRDCMGGAFGGIVDDIVSPHLFLMDGKLTPIALVDKVLR